MSSSNSASGKLTIIALDKPAAPGKASLEAQYNPKEIGVDKKVPWQKAPTSTGDQPEMQFTSAEGRTMSFEMFFDTYEEGSNVHTKYVGPLIALAMVMEPGGKEEKKRPPRVRILWGNGALPQFDGVIASVGTKYTMFKADGTPVRATCNVQITEASSATFKAGASGASGAPAA